MKERRDNLAAQIHLLLDISDISVKYSIVLFDVTDSGFSDTIGRSTAMLVPNLGIILTAREGKISVGN